MPYRAICKEIDVSKATCGKWNEEFKQQIAEHKKDKLQELYNNYFMIKESRIKQIGETLKKVNKALEDKDLSELAADKLLDFKIKYINELKEEYVYIDDAKSMQEIDAEKIIKEFSGLLERVREGNITPLQANKEVIILSNMLKAYEATTIEKKLDELKGLLNKQTRRNEK